jgi:hypothetical protein
MPPPNAKIGRWFMLYKTMLGYIKLNWGMAFPWSISLNLWSYEVSYKLFTSITT